MITFLVFLLLLLVSLLWADDTRDGNDWRRGPRLP
jgi:hypothetical protein